MWANNNWMVDCIWSAGHSVDTPCSGSGVCEHEEKEQRWLKEKKWTVKGALGGWSRNEMGWSGNHCTSSKG